jgi:hypothetical protein
MQIPFVGPTYNSRSSNIDASRSVNFYPEMNPADSKSVMALIGTPGTNLFEQLPTSPVRGMHVFGALMYVVAGNTLYSVTIAGSVSAALGTLATSTGLVAMEDNGLAASGVGGNQLIIVDGVNGYIYNASTGAFTTISGGGWPMAGSGTVTYIDGYFVIGNANSMSASASNLYDGTTWNALATSPIGAAPDLVQAVINIHQQLWIIKQHTSEVWYDAGTATDVGFPFSRISGAVIDYGTPAPASVARGDNSFFFLAMQRNNDMGEFVGVVEVSGYVPQIISTPAITYQMQQYVMANNGADAFGYCYSGEGHTFYVITFPTGNATWVYDASTQMWHERSTWVGTPYVIGRHIGNCYAGFYARHFIGDWQNGNIYEMLSTTYTDNGNPLVSMRTAQHLFDKKDLDHIFIRRLILDMETGIGDGAYSFETGINPQAALAWSDDGGHTWSNQYTASMGAAGRYRTRVIWRRLGHSRDRIFQVTISDPVKKILIGAYAS